MPTVLIILASLLGLVLSEMDSEKPESETRRRVSHAQVSANGVVGGGRDSGNKSRLSHQQHNRPRRVKAAEPKTQLKGEDDGARQDHSDGPSDSVSR